MSRIHILPDNLVSQIAAGEVVERPASVVKELLENALDAGARSIAIELEGGGKRRIRVRDDGCGMDRDDALSAFDRHATSKIASFEDLQEIASLGFRGEALASIAAVARVELLTAVEAGEGTRVRIEGGRIRSTEPTGHPRGTSIEVASLFFNVPARRKFLKAPQTELRRALEVAQGYALARPDVEITLRHEGRALLEGLGVGEGPAGARERIGRIFGADLVAGLTPIAGSDVAGTGPFWGFVGNPTTGRSRRTFTFVNRRLLRDRAVMATFYRAVREEWRSEDFPALFLFLDIPPEEVDVNVHPQKSEVRFRDRAVLDGLSAALRLALRRALGESAAPAGLPGADLSGAALAWRGLGERGPGEKGPGEPEAGDWRAGYPQGERFGGEVGESGGPAWGPPGRMAEAVYAPLERLPVPLSGRRGGPRSLRLLGQYKGSLILLEGPAGLYLVDQHVAHERVLYERLRRDLERETTPSQALLEPLLLELAPAERLRLLELADGLEACGYALQEMSGGTLAVTAVPAAVALEEAHGMLLTLAAGGQAGEDDDKSVRERLLDTLAASLSCREAVKMHHPLTADEMELLVAELFAAEQPYACPHGRPIVLEMTDADLERRFGRR